MSNPYTRSGLTSFPVSGNLTAMPNGTTLGLGVVSGVVAGAPYADIIVAPVQLKTGTGAVSSSAYCNLYLALSEDNVDWDGTISPSVSGSQTALSTGLRLIQTLNTPASGTIYSFNEFSVYASVGFIPSFFTVLVSNQTAQTLDVSGANFVAKYATDSYT